MPTEDLGDYATLSGGTMPHHSGSGHSSMRGTSRQVCRYLSCILPINSLELSRINIFECKLVEKIRTYSSTKTNYQVIVMLCQTLLQNFICCSSVFVN